MISNRSLGIETEVERRQARRGTMPLVDILEAFARGADRHMTAGPATEQELRRLEQALGHPLPASFRAFLSRLGGGLFFHGHEIFGPRRVMIHDIELVPDVLSVRRRLVKEGGLPQGILPLHRARGVIHVIDVRPENGGEWIDTLSPSLPYADLASFLETVVLPRPRLPARS